MRKGAVLAALAALGAATLAFAARLPDSVSTSEAVYARRGSLGSNDYVATNVAPCNSAYRIVRVTDGRLRDRAVNVIAVTNDVTLALPGRRTTAGCARMLCAVLNVGASGECRVLLEGAAKVYATDSTDALSVGNGVHFLQIVEIGDNEYLADVSELRETEKEGE